MFELMIKSSVFLSYRQIGVSQKTKVDVLGYGTNALFMLMCLLMNRGASSCLFFRAWGHMVARFAKNVSCYNHHQGQRGGPTYSLLFSTAATAAAATTTAACRLAQRPAARRSGSLPGLVPPQPRAASDRGRGHQRTPARRHRAAGATHGHSQY